MSSTSTTSVSNPKMRSEIQLANGKQRKILLSSNSAWNLANFRKPIIEALVAAGVEVVAVAPADGHEQALIGMGASFRPIAMSGTGTSPFEDARLLLDYLSLIRAERPASYLGFTAKPNIYGSLAARMLGVPVVATISGLGSAFLKGGLIGGILMRLYRVALGTARTVMFQNPTDRALFISARIVRPDQARLVAGSGVDLLHFAPAPPSDDRHFTFLLIARLLLDKGISEFVKAAKIVRARHPNARFQLLGAGGGDNPSAVPEADLTRWRGEQIVELLGASEDVRPFIAAAHCVVLPSYREGLPRSLLEGAAMARPLIASDVPGCREVIDDGLTGLLCDVRSAGSLAAAMQQMIDMTAADRAAMGRAGRRKIEAEYDQRLVVEAYLAELER
ncbi:MAG: glycosyltransferase family 4 protein [Sphingomicrobium sp.]